MKNNTQWFVRMFGDTKAHKEHILVVLAMFSVTLLYEWLASIAVPDFSFNWYEFVGTFAGLVCVWLTRTQNVLCWPWGIISAVSFGFFFSEIGLPGQQWLNWGYFLIIQLWAWPHWVFGGKEHSELPVTKLHRFGWLLLVVCIVVGTGIVYQLIDYISPTAQYPLLDALVVSSSITAQFLLGRKIVESWWLWLGPVNLLSIILFFLAGAYVATALYGAFFIHAMFALRTWYRDLQLRN